MPKMKTYNLFISHSWEYNYEYYRLLEMLDNALRFKYRDYSVPEHDPLNTRNDRQLEQAIYNQIRPAHIVIFIARMYVPYREWIQGEMSMAMELRKPIICVIPWGALRVPQDVQEVADEIVGWNTSSIVGAIRRTAL